MNINLKRKSLIIFSIIGIVLTLAGCNGNITAKCGERGVKEAITKAGKAIIICNNENVYTL